MTCACGYREGGIPRYDAESLERKPVTTIHGDGEQVTVPNAFTFRGICDDCGLHTTPELVPLAWRIEWKDRATGGIE